MKAKAAMATMRVMRVMTRLAVVAVAMVGALSAWGQGAPAGSTEVHDDGRVTFRLAAPNAERVMLSGSDIPGLGRGAMMEKGEGGMWEVTVGPLEGGAYRYTFNVDGVAVVDPRNELTSESNGNVWSLMYVPGVAFMDSQRVEHGAVAEVVYWSDSLGRDRRMHVYMPAGYEKGAGEYPVFYLLHGAYDSDDAWSTVGRAGYILDNLIASGEAKPMVVVMPDGHTAPFGSGMQLPIDDFVADFEGSVRPYVESHYRVKTGRGDRAIAGLSMGGAHTLEIAMRNLEDYGYVGVFSSGVFALGGNGEQGDGWKAMHKAALEDAGKRAGLKKFWFAIGEDDFLLQISRRTVEMLRGFGFEVVDVETSGGHTWPNWRNYLHEFAPMLFK